MTADAPQSPPPFPFPQGPAPVRRRRPPRAVPRWYGDAAGAFAWLSMLVVVALWVTGGGVRDVADVLGAAGLTTLGRVTGLVSADLLLIQVLLMARIPLVERAYGQDELARRHRLVGFWSFNLMLAHVVLITLGYAATTRAGIIAEFLQLVLTYPGMLLALAGTTALTLVAVTSIRAARARLRYEDWHLLHLYAYLGVGLALPHQLWTGCGRAPASSSPGGSSTGPGGRAGTRTPSRPRPRAPICGSRRRTSVTAAAGCPASGRGPGYSSRVRTAGCTPASGPGAG